MEGARLRLRPILMTSFAFILGCVPLWTASGAGAVARQIMGTTVIGGMVAASGIGIFLVPAIFYVVEKVVGSGCAARAAPLIPATASAWRGRLIMRRKIVLDPDCSASRRLHGRSELQASRGRGSAELSRAGAAAARRRPNRSPTQMVRGIPGRETAGADPHGAGAKLRSARCRRARRRGARQLLASRARISFRISAPAARWRSTASRAMAQRRCRRSFCLRRTAISDRRRCSCCRSKWIFGAGCAAPPKPRARTCWAPRRTARRWSPPWSATWPRRTLTLRELDYALEISQTHSANARAVARTDADRGRRAASSTLLDLRQAEQLVYTAAETIPGIQQQIEQTENQINLLLGENPGNVSARAEPHRTGAAAGSSRRLAFRACWSAVPISVPRSRI